MLIFTDMRHTFRIVTYHIQMVIVYIMIIEKNIKKKFFSNTIWYYVMIQDVKKKDKIV